MNLNYSQSISGGYSEYSTNPAGTRDEFDYPDVVNYNPGSNYSVDHLGDSRYCRYLFVKW